LIKNAPFLFRNNPFLTGAGTYHREDDDQRHLRLKKKRGGERFFTRRHGGTEEEEKEDQRMARMKTNEDKTMWEAPSWEPQPNGEVVKVPLLMTVFVCFRWSFGGDKTPSNAL
jgi:hypothetical protein